jgi:hypothetical protein
MAIRTALSLLCNVLFCMHSELIKNLLDEKHDEYSISGFLRSSFSYNIVDISSPTVYRLAGLCVIDPVLPSSVVMMSTTPKSLMSPSDLVLPTTNNEKVVHRLAGVCKIDPVLHSSVVMMSTAIMHIVC